MTTLGRTFVAVGVVLGLAAPAAALELTGTWSGSTACTSFFEGAKLKFKDAPMLQVTQSGDVLGVRADYGGGHVDFYAGHVYPDAKKPDEKGEIALVACGTDSVAGNEPAFDELGRFSVSTKTGKIKATLKGLSFFSDPGVASPEAGTCKWKITRVDTADAGVGTDCALAMSLALSAGGGAAPDRSPAAPTHRRR